MPNSCMEFSDFNNLNFTFQATNFNHASRVKEMPRLVIILEDGEKMDNGFILADGLSMKCQGDCLRDLIAQLRFTFYAWDLVFPRSYQVLGFLQCHMLKDVKNVVFKAISYRAFEKLYFDV